MWGDRSGREPVRARSPLGLRKSLSVIGAAVSVAAIGVVIAVRSFDGWAWVVAGLSILAIIGIADAAIITRKLQR